MFSDLCASSDELSDHEKTAELLPISVQQLYVLRLLGEVEQAEALAAEIAVEEYVVPVQELDCDTYRR